MTKNNITELVFILDRSGSMHGLESDTIGGFNSMIDNQKKEEGKALVTTVLFDNRIETLHDRVPLEDVKEMTDKDYTTGATTALLDAIGETIDKIGLIQKHIRKEDVPEHTLFAITTDGLENASRRYSSEQVKKMIKEHEEKGWEFLFVGANIDAVETATSLGIREENAVDYMADGAGTNVVFRNLSNAVGSLRRKGKVDASWSAEIKEDYENRKN